MAMSRKDAEAIAAAVAAATLTEEDKAALRREIEDGELKAVAACRALKGMLDAATKRAEEAERAAAWRAHERDSEAKRVSMHMKRAAAAEKRIGELEAALGLIASTGEDTQHVQPSGSIHDHSCFWCRGVWRPCATLIARRALKEKP